MGHIFFTSWASLSLSLMQLNFSLMGYSQSLSHGTHCQTLRDILPMHSPTLFLSPKCFLSLLPSRIKDLGGQPLRFHRKSTPIAVNQAALSSTFNRKVIVQKANLNSVRKFSVDFWFFSIRLIFYNSQQLKSQFLHHDYYS